jgi:hypothetical protein
VTGALVMIFARTLRKRMVAFSVVICAVTVPARAAAQPPPSDSSQSPSPTSAWQFGGFIDVPYLNSFNDPDNHLFRNRGTTPRVDEWDADMLAAYVRKTATDKSRFGTELTAQTGEDSKTFGFSATAPNISDADLLRHLGPTNGSCLAPIGKGLTIQAGIFNSLIGYDSLYAKENFAYTRPWGADYTPYLMLGVNASYPMSDKLTATFAVVNGYWHLAHANDVPSVVGQLAYKPAGDKVTVKETVLYGSHQPATALEFWRVLSDTIVERKAGPLTIAGEYQFATERVDASGNPRAVWMAAQLPVRYVVRDPWSITVRPEFAWDRDGRWISGVLGAGQSIKAITSTLEYRVPSYKGAGAIVRVEHRYDSAEGPAGGFFKDGAKPTGNVQVVSGQNLFIVALILTFDSAARK